MEYSGDTYGKELMGWERMKNTKYSFFSFYIECYLDVIIFLLKSKNLYLMYQKKIKSIYFNKMNETKDFKFSSEEYGKYKV